MPNVVKVTYDDRNLKTTITVNDKSFDTSRIDGKEIEDWAYPFMIRKIKWNGFYEEMVKALNGAKSFDLMFDGSENALNELKESWENAPVNVVSSDDDNVVIISYDENSLKTEITVNGKPFDTSRIDGKEIEDWVYPFMMRKIKWDGIFEELSKVIGTQSYTIRFLGKNEDRMVLIKESPNNVTFCKNNIEIQKNNQEISYKLQEAENLFLHAKLQEAFPILKELANKGIGRAMYLLAEYYSRTFGQIKRDEVLYWREKGAKCGDLLAKLNSPQLYDDFNKTFSQIFPQIKQMAENGDLFAKFELTFLDSKDGNRYLNEVLDAGYFLAQMNMAKAYSGLMIIDGIKKNLEQAAKWYRKAAEQGYAKAQYELSECYYFGHGVAQDYSEAFFWSSKSAEQGDSNGQESLGDCYYFGHGVQQSYEKAVEWYTESANQGNVSAIYDLAICYYYGNGVETNYQQATELFTIAVDKGHVESMNLLGDCYYEGKGVAQNYPKAVSLYERALNENSPQAYYNLGSCYRWGNGVRKDKEKAKELFKKGIELGNQNCKEAYEDMLKNADRIETAKRIGGKILTVLGEVGVAYAQSYYSNDDDE